MRQADAITTIDEYLEAAPEPVRAPLAALRAAIRAAAPAATERISYAMPTFYLNGSLVHFAAFRNHIGFYPAPSGIAAFRDELKGYRGAKGSVQFPLGEPLPLELVARIVAFRVGENTAKPRARRR